MLYLLKSTRANVAAALEARTFRIRTNFEGISRWKIRCNLNESPGRKSA